MTSSAALPSFLLPPRLCHPLPSDPYAYDNEYEWIINGLGGGVTYWIRCAAYLEGGYGPWCPSIPPSIDTDK